MQVRDQNHCSC